MGVACALGAVFAAPDAQAASITCAESLTADQTRTGFGGSVYTDFVIVDFDGGSRDVFDDTAIVAPDYGLELSGYLAGSDFWITPRIFEDYNGAPGVRRAGGVDGPSGYTFNVDTGTTGAGDVNTTRGDSIICNTLLGHAMPISRTGRCIPATF